MQRKPNAPWRHHYLPEFYLREWAAADGRIHRYTPTPSGLNQRRVFPSAAGFIENLYTIKGCPDPWDATFLEHRFFSGLDSEAAQAFRKLRIEGNLVTIEERAIWAAFLSSLLLRTPTNIAATTLLIGQLLAEDSTGLAERYAKRRGPNDPETLNEWIEKEGRHGLAQTAIRTLPFQTTNLKRNQQIVQMRWGVLAIKNTKYSFLASDSPLIIRPVKLDGGHMALPLGPDRLFIASEQDGVFQELGSTPGDEVVRRVNENVAGAARVFVAAKDGMQDRFIRNRFGCMPSNIFAPDQEVAGFRADILARQGRTGP